MSSPLPSPPFPGAELRFRHFAVHQYFDVSAEGVYGIAANDTPDLVDAVLDWLRAERPLVAQAIEERSP